MPETFPEGTKCDCCGYGNHLAGVASASAPISIMWCHVCLGMRAEPMAVFEVAEVDPKKSKTFAHFDKEQDKYFFGSRHLPIKTAKGSWDKRGDLPDTLP